jgi:hypothetical protein
VGISCLEGSPVHRYDMLLPCLSVLPMGWNWSLLLAQAVTRHSILSCGFPMSRLVEDRLPGRVVDSDLGPAAAGYVDNFAVLGLHREEVCHARDAISSRLRGLGFRVHEELEPSPVAEFVGLEFSSQPAIVRIKKKRLWRVALAITEILRRGTASPAMLEILIGHVTWILMVRRESLAIINDCYRFIRASHGPPVRLWKSVRHELSTILAILPLLHSHLYIPWHPRVTMSDASPTGVGVCTMHAPLDVVGAVGRVSEKWRYDHESSTAARAHALGVVETATPPPPFPDVIAGGADPFRPSLARFEEVPASLLDPAPWTVVHSRKLAHPENILRSEMRALEWGVRHCFRSSHSFGRRHLFLVDNLPLALGCVKGRARSGHLKSGLKVIAAHALATRARIVVRWIPSESNLADGPSRGWGWIPRVAPSHGPPPGDHGLGGVSGEHVCSLSDDGTVATGERRHLAHDPARLLDPCDRPLPLGAREPPGLERSDLARPRGDRVLELPGEQGCERRGRFEAAGRAEAACRRASATCAWTSRVQSARAGVGCACLRRDSACRCLGPACWR